MDCSYDSDSCERKSLFCSEPLQTFGLALGCSACLKASYHSNCVRARKNGSFSSLCQCCLHVRRSKDRRLTLVMHRILTLSVVTILQVLPGTLDPEELFNYLTPSDLPSEDILSMFEQLCHGDVVRSQERFMLEIFYFAVLENRANNLY